MSSKKLVPMVGPDPHTPEWTAMRVWNPERTERPVVFGASEAASAANLNPYDGGPLSLFMKKREMVPKFEGNEATQFGILLEPVVLTMYEMETERCLRRDLPMYLHPEHSFMAATPDALVVEGGEWERAVDAKTATFRVYDKTGEDEHKYGEEGTDQVPAYILCQAQQQMAVLGLDRVDFPVLFDRRIRIYSVLRSDDMIAMLVEAERELAERIINNDPPEPNWEHPKTKSLLRDLYGMEAGKVCDLDDETAVLVREYQQLGAELKAMEKDRERLGNKIRAVLGDAQIGRHPLLDIELNRVAIAAAYWSQDDVDKAEAMLGTIKRAAHDQLRIRKVTA